MNKISASAARSSGRRAPSNHELAERLVEMASVLDRQGDDGFRGRAYRRAAKSVRAARLPLDEIYAETELAGLDELAGAGASIAHALAEMIVTGGWTQLQRLRGELEPEHILGTVPSIGPKLAAKIHEALHIESLEAPENAALDGRLARIDGIGAQRSRNILARLRDMRAERRLPFPLTGPTPPAEILLEIDRRYRQSAASGKLAKIAPKRHNQSGKAWLPVLHSVIGEWRFPALYSNTERAHQLGRTKDWVVIYAHIGRAADLQHTIVTETHGPLVGQLVVRGCKGECIAHYAKVTS